MKAPSEKHLLEGSPLQSKKFIAYMLTESLWKGIIFTMIWTHGDNLTMQGSLLAALLVAGFISVAYIGGQAALDHYTRVARIVGGKGPVIRNDEEDVR